MSEKPFNDLTPAEVERLALLAEECGEVVQAVGKILRHGYESYHPDTGEWNRPSLEKEIGDVQAVVSMMQQAGDIRPENIGAAKRKKLAKVARFLHHAETAKRDVTRDHRANCCCVYCEANRRRAAQ